MSKRKNEYEYFYISAKDELAKCDKEYAQQREKLLRKLKKVDLLLKFIFVFFMLLIIAFVVLLAVLQADLCLLGLMATSLGGGYLMSFIAGKGARIERELDNLFFEKITAGSSF